MADTEALMFECHVCGSHTARRELVSEVFQIDGRRVLVENIPAEVCTRCAAPTFSAESGENVRKLVHGNDRPNRTVTLDVFALS